MGNGRAPWRAEPGSETYERVRAEIVLAAEQLINETGIAGLRVGLLADRMGCTRQNLYRYFASKEELVAAALLQQSERFGAHLAKRVEKVRDPGERLIEGLVEGVEIVRKNRYLRSYFEGASAPEMLAFIANSKGLLQSTVGMLDPVLDDAETWIRPDLTREDVAEWLIRIFINELIWSATVRRTRAQRREFLLRLVLPSLQGGSRSGPAGEKR